MRVCKFVVSTGYIILTPTDKMIPEATTTTTATQQSDFLEDVILSKYEMVGGALLDILRICTAGV